MDLFAYLAFLSLPLGTRTLRVVEAPTPTVRQFESVRGFGGMGKEE